VITKDFLAKNIIVNSANDNVVDINLLFQNSNLVRDSFLDELEYFRVNYFWNYNWYPPTNITPTTGQPPIGDRGFYTYDYCSNVVDIIIDEIQSNNFVDCFELKILRPIGIPDNIYGIDNHGLNFFSEIILYSVPHPLNLSQENNGYSLYTNSFQQDLGDEVLFNYTLLNSLEKNVIIVRPVRNTFCQYSNLNVQDFTYFLDF
jgi:hypothetical protein